MLGQAFGDNTKVVADLIDPPGPGRIGGHHFHVHVRLSGKQISPTMKQNAHFNAKWDLVGH